jgi:hypothetical protein
MERAMFGVWIRYFAVIPGLPAIGDPEEADVLIIQAFGRNTYGDEELDIVRTIYERSGGNDATAIEKLREVSFNPGIPNYDLAQEAQEIADRYDLPIITQWEVAVAFNPEWYAVHKERIICIWPPGGTEYFTTWHVKTATWKIMKEKGWKTPVELAHKSQIARSFLVVKKVMHITPVVLPQRTKSFDPNSVQPWIRSWRKFVLPREIIVRWVHHIIKRWVF